MGLGGIGQRHLRIFRELYKEAEIFAIRVKGSKFEIDNNLQLKRNNIYEKYGVSELKSYKDLSDINPDISFVTNPTSLHISSAKIMVENHIPCFIEKPISNDNEGVADLLKLSQKNSTQVMVGFMMRFHPQAIKIKDFLSKGYAGRIYGVTVNVNSYMPSWHPYESYKDLYASRRDLGGGVILTESHELDLLHWFFGEAKLVNLLTGKFSNFQMDVEDNATLFLKQKYLKHSFPSTIQLSFVQKEPIRRLLILAEEAVIEWDIANSDLKIKAESGRSFEDKIEEFDRNSLFSEQISHMLNCLANKELPINDLASCMFSHETIMSCYESLDN